MLCNYMQTGAMLGRVPRLPAFPAVSPSRRRPKSVGDLEADFASVRNHASDLFDHPVLGTALKR
jgi:hypothetical protein